MVFVETPYGQNHQLLTNEGIGGSSYTPTNLASDDGSRQPVDDKLETARNVGSRAGHRGPQGGTPQQGQGQQEAVPYTDEG